MMPDLVRADGLGWAFGRAAGAYGQMHCVSLILQGLRDGWIPDDQTPAVFRHPAPALPLLLPDLPRPGARVPRPARRGAHRLREAHDAHGELRRRALPLPVVAPREDGPDARRRPLGGAAPHERAFRHLRQVATARSRACSSTATPKSGLHLHAPAHQLRQATSRATPCPSPIAPGVFDWPNNVYLPVMLPELTFGENVTLPAFYGKNCVTGLGMRNSFFFRYEQPDLITTKEEIVRNLGSVKVQWTFAGSKVALRVRLHGEAAGHARQVPLRPGRRRAPFQVPRPRFARPRAPRPPLQRDQGRLPGHLAGHRGGERRSDLPHQLRQDPLPAVPRPRPSR